MLGGSRGPLNSVDSVVADVFLFPGKQATVQAIAPVDIQVCHISYMCIYINFSFVSCSCSIDPDAMHISHKLQDTRGEYLIISFNAVPPFFFLSYS